MKKRNRKPYSRKRAEYEGRRDAIESWERFRSILEPGFKRYSPEPNDQRYKDMKAAFLAGYLAGLANVEGTPSDASAPFLDDLDGRIAAGKRFIQNMLNEHFIGAFWTW